MNERPKTIRVAEKLKQIRVGLDLSQNEMLECMGLDEWYDRAYISQWETGKAEPPYIVVLRYAQAYSVSTDYLLNDALSLPPPPVERFDHYSPTRKHHPRFK
ncbi:MAG: helix-turn-helix transcriptional regulator [Chloracidobacterium sp.]|nr:helix-turn-helix transcriptional regulator [Chloracidobacterium sp.]